MVDVDRQGRDLVVKSLAGSHSSGVGGWARPHGRDNRRPARFNIKGRSF